MNKAWPSHDSSLVKDWQLLLKSPETKGPRNGSKGRKHPYSELTLFKQITKPLKDLIP